jgi:hypothetical protein
MQEIGSNPHFTIQLISRSLGAQDAVVFIIFLTIPGMAIVHTFTSITDAVWAFLAPNDTPGGNSVLPVATSPLSPRQNLSKGPQVFCRLVQGSWRQDAGAFIALGLLIDQLRRSARESHVTCQLVE